MANPSNHSTVLQSLEELVTTVRCLSGKMSLLTQKPCPGTQSTSKKTVILPYANRRKDRGHNYVNFTVQNLQSPVCKKRVSAVKCVPKASRPVAVKRLQVPHLNSTKSPRVATPPQKTTSSTVHCQTEEEPIKAVCPVSPQVMEVRLKVDDSLSAVSKCGRALLSTGPPCLNQCYVGPCPRSLGTCNLSPSNSGSRVLRRMEELTLEVRDLTRAVINTPSCGYHYGEYYSQLPPPLPSLSQMTCVVANPLDTALLYVTRNLNERLRNLGNTMHHMIDQYPLPHGDQSSRGYRIEETTAARLLTVLQGNMKEAVRDLRTSLNRPMSRPHPLDQNPNRERLEISRLLADVVGLVGVIRKDFRDIVLGNNQILSQSIIRTTVNCPRPPSPQIYLDSRTIPAISVQQCPQSSEISKKTLVDLASDSAVEEPPMEADDPAKEIHFEHVPVQTGCSKVTEVMPSLPGKACMPLTHLIDRPKATGGDNQTRSVSQKCLRFARSSAVPPKYEKPKLSGLSGEKRLQQVTEKARPPFSASSSQSMSLEDDAPEGANSLPNDIPIADSRTVTTERSSSSTEGCLPVRSLLNCLQRSDKHKEAPTSAPQLQNLEAKQTPVTLESEKSSGSQPSDNRSDDTKEKKQLTSEGTALKTSAHVPNETDEGIFSLEVDEAVAEITTSPQNGALRGDFHLEHPLKVQFLREIPADVNTLFCKQPNLTKGLLASEENCVEMPYTEVSSVLLPTECSGEDFEEEDAYLSSSPQTSEEENNTEDARARHHNSDVGEEGCAQGLEKIASAREQLVSILDLLDRSEQQEYSEEEFLRELKQLNLESDLPSTQGYYATSLPGSLPLLPEWNSTVVRLPPSTTPASASLRTATRISRSQTTTAVDSSHERGNWPTRISRSQTTTAVDGSHERGNWPTEGVGLRSSTEAEAMKRQSLQEPSVVGAKAGRSDSSDAPTPKDASPRTINDKNRQKYDERKRHPSLGLVEEARSHSVDEAELNVRTDQPSAKESPQVEDSSNRRTESLRETEPSDLLSSYAEKRGKNEEGVSNDRLLVPEIKIANESSQGLPDAVTEKSNTDDLNRRREHDSAVAAPISNEPVLRVIDCRPIPFLDKSTSVGNPTNCSPTLGSDSNVVCKAQCGNTLSQEILQDYYKLLTMAGRGTMTCHEWCPHRQPHLRNERQTYTCCCTGAVDDWRPICRPRAYGECSERQLDGTTYTDCDRRPCGIPDGCPPQCGTRRCATCGECSERQLDGTIFTNCGRQPCRIPDVRPPPCRTRKCATCGECSERQFGGAIYTVCDRQPYETSDCCAPPCGARNFPSIVNVPKVPTHRRSEYKSCDEFRKSCRHRIPAFNRCASRIKGTTGLPFGGAPVADRRTFRGDMAKAANARPNPSFDGLKTNGVERSANGCHCGVPQYAKCRCVVAKARCRDAINKGIVDNYQKGHTMAPALNPTAVQNFHSSANQPLENEDYRNQNLHGSRKSHSTTDSDNDGRTFTDRSTCFDLKFQNDCDVCQSVSTSVSKVEETPTKCNVEEMPPAVCHGSLDEIVSGGRDRDCFQDKDERASLLDRTSFRRSCEPPEIRNERVHGEPTCSSRFSRRQPEVSRQEFGPALRRDCDNFLRVDLCGATGLQEAPDQECLPCHEPPSQSDVMQHSSWRSAIPCRPVDTPPAVHRSSKTPSQREFDTNTVQTVDAQLMDVLERVESMVSTPFPPNRLLKDALAVVNASVDARRKVRAGCSGIKSFSSPDEGKRCGFQSKKPVPLARKRSSEYVNVWWLDSPVKVRRRKKRRGKLSRRAEVNELQIAKEKAAALSENSTDQLIQILDLLERRDRTETTGEEALSEMQTAQCSQLDNPSTTACQTPSKPDASPAVRTESPSCRCCSHLLAPQRPTNIVVLPPPQQYTHTDNYTRPNPHPFAAQSAASTSWPSVWSWTRQMGPPRAPASWFTESPISDWLSALLGDYGGLGGGGGGGSKPLRITIREVTNNGAKEDEEGQ